MRLKVYLYVIFAVLVGFMVVSHLVPASAEGPADWVAEFPLTDFSIRSIDFGEIDFDGARRDTITPVRIPQFIQVSDTETVGVFEPVLSVIIDGDARAYPLAILLWHEIVNDVGGGVPILVSYCPLCNSGVVFDRRVNGEVLEFGNTGRLRNFDMVMYDKATESWWQQFLGEALIGALTGTRMDLIPARLESLANFGERAPNGLVLVPENSFARAYGTTPYTGMDTAKVSRARFPYPLPDGVEPLSRVVIVGDQAWTLDLVRDAGRIDRGDLVLTWEPGQNSIHDQRFIAFGRDIGNVVVRRQTADGLVDVAYDVAFAFAFAAFVPDGTLHTE